MSLASQPHHGSVGVDGGLLISSWVLISSLLSAHPTPNLSRVLFHAGLRLNLEGGLILELVLGMGSEHLSDLPQITEQLKKRTEFESTSSKSRLSPPSCVTTGHNWEFWVPRLPLEGIMSCNLHFQGESPRFLLKGSASELG